MELDKPIYTPAFSLCFLAAGVMGPGLYSCLDGRFLFLGGNIRTDIHRLSASQLEPDHLGESFENRRRKNWDFTENDKARFNLSLSGSLGPIFFIILIHDFS